MPVHKILKEDGIGHVSRFERIEAALREFTEDIERVGTSKTAMEWPDLIITYRRAKRALEGKDDAEI